MINFTSFIYYTPVSLVLMIINELSVWKKHETTITKEKLTFQNRMQNHANFFFKLPVSSSVSQIKKIKLRNRVISRFLASYLITNNVKRIACKFSG